jgi:hypothetical protein
MSADLDKYTQDVMLTCKILLDSLKEGTRLELSELISSPKSRLEFVARIVKFGDTFKSDSTRPIFGMLFATEGDDYILREAHDIGIGDNVRVKVTIQPVEDGAANGD